MYQVINDEGEVEFESRDKMECIAFCKGFTLGYSIDEGPKYLIDAECVVDHYTHVLLAIRCKEGE